MIKSDVIADLIQAGLTAIDLDTTAPAEAASPLLTGATHIVPEDPFLIVPPPDLDELRTSGAASVDLRLGTWFMTPKQARIPYLQAGEKIFGGELSGGQTTQSNYVPFGQIYWLHPRSFVLGVTLEWLRFPAKYGGYVTSRSSWGRRGLVIATATGVHPSFTGCLTLELSNVGEIPIPLRPGMALCQLFVHEATTGTGATSKPARGRFAGTRRPRLGEIEPDNFSRSVSTAYTSGGEVE